MRKKVIGVDIGGTNLRIALIDDSGNILKRRNTASGADVGVETVVENLINLLRGFTEEEIIGVGIGVPGTVHSASGVITQAPNLRGVDNYPLRDVVAEKLGRSVPVFVENDANCAALGEWWVGAGKGKSSLMLLTIGTGLGGGIILDGKLWSGADGMAGEAGHTTVYPDGARCKCGNTGCLEAYASAVGMRRMVKEGLENKSLKTVIREMIRTVPEERIPEVAAKAAFEGDRFALQIWEEFGKALGIAMANFINLLNMEMIVISGGISNSWELFIDRAVSEAKKRAWRVPMERVKIRRTSLGDDAGLLGAAYPALKT